MSSAILNTLIPRASDWTIPQAWHLYGADEHAMWDQLYTRQMSMLPARVTPEFLTGIDLLKLSKPGIPNFDHLNKRLSRCSGWSVHAVQGLVPDEVFFEHLANRRFVAGRFIRTPAQADYLKEPDIFHDVFGHVPLLAHPVFADYMQAYGRGGLRAAQHGAIQRLSRLYWYTVEFGLIRSDANLKLFGSGIVSSNAESYFALDDESPHRLRFDLKRVMRTRYRIDDFQQCYFVIDSYEDLLRQTLDTDFVPLYDDLRNEPDLDPGELIASDLILNYGSQRHANQTTEILK